MAAGESMDEGKSCTIRIPDDFEETSCFLVKFSNGQLNPAPSRLPKISLYNKTKDASKKKKIIVAETDGLMYTGTNFNPDTVTSSSQCCVGALDRSTGTLTLYKAEQFTLSPHIPGSRDVEVGEEIAVSGDQPSTREALDQTVSFFGSERRKRALSTAQKNKLESGVLETALEPAISHAEANIVESPAAESAFQASGLKPPHNPAAEVPRDVYNVNDIISLAEFKALQNVSVVFTEATSAQIEEWRTNETYPEYVLQRVPELPSEEPDRSLKAAILLYVSFLIQMHNMTSRKVQRGGLAFEGTWPPPEVLEQLQDKFTEKRVLLKRTEHALPVRMKDKLRLHLLVLCLILDDFSVPCAVLQKDLKITANKLLDYFRALGCVTQRTGVKRKLVEEDGEPATPNQTLCILKIPLSFPRPRKGRKKKE